MASKKKSKKPTKSKAASRKRAATPKRVTKKKTAKKLTVGKRASTSRKKAATSSRAPGKASRSRRSPAPWDQEPVTPRSGAQSGDLQGLSDLETADSESVDELLEEGNAFEAEAVAGVEHADDDHEREVHTHESPEDDVPEEYRNQD
jgi:hypothetical protein